MYYIGDPEGLEADNEISDVTNEIPLNVFMIEDQEWGNIENFMAMVTANSNTGGTTSNNANRNQTHVYEDLALPSTSAQSSSSSSSNVLALPPPPPSQQTETTPMDTSEPVMTVAIPPDMSVVSTQTGKYVYVI